MPTRSELIFRAAVQIPSRFLLVQATAKAARKMHRANASTGRMANTINDVLKLIDASTADSVIDPNPIPIVFCPCEDDLVLTANRGLVHVGALRDTVFLGGTLAGVIV
jgi:hypothetical protein